MNVECSGWGIHGAMEGGMVNRSEHIRPVLSVLYRLAVLPLGPTQSARYYLESFIWLGPGYLKYHILPYEPDSMLHF